MWLALNCKPWKKAWTSYKWRHLDALNFIPYVILPAQDRFLNIRDAS